MLELQLHYLIYFRGKTLKMCFPELPLSLLGISWAKKALTESIAKDSLPVVKKFVGLPLAYRFHNIPASPLCPIFPFHVTQLGYITFYMPL